MKTFKVTITETYIYDEVEAENKQDALDQVVRNEAWDDCDNPWSSEVEENKEA